MAKEEVAMPEAEEKGETKDEQKKPPVPVVRRISFSDVKRSTHPPEKRGIMRVSARELDLNEDDLGMSDEDTIGLLYRPMRPNEDAEIREIVKDFPETQWQDEYFKEIIIRCLEDAENPGQPMIPDTFEGRNWLDRWLVGTRSYLARAIQNQSGLGVHIVTNAKEELGKLQALPPRTSSN